MTEGILLAFDYGTHFIGVAVGQELTGTATALTTVRSHNCKPDWKSIDSLVDQWRPSRLVVGLPLNMDGTEHDLTRAARRFGNQMAGRYNLPVEAVDERLTSIEAEQILSAAGGRPEKAEVDKLAAQLILQTWLDERPKKR